MDAAIRKLNMHYLIISDSNLIAYIAFPYLVVLFPQHTQTHLNNLLLSRLKEFLWCVDRKGPVSSANQVPANLWWVVSGTRLQGASEREEKQCFFCNIQGEKRKKQHPACFHVIKMEIISLKTR